MRKEDFELLAPAGSFTTFKAVIEAGADAVYVGGSRFGARAYADNFNEEELLEALDYAHLHGVKVYLTINTLLKNNEVKKELFDYLLPFYKKGLDAVLVQDFGVLKFIHENFPKLPIHTSTQMTVTGVEGALFLKQYGVTRVVMAREVSLKEMKRIRQEADIEIEAFVHGALCYCYSGQCLFSSLLGGRSGNRGRCAQPCRLSYSVLDDNREKLKSDSYILSLKDMCGVNSLEKLKEAGVYSLKIEGRMKQPTYAAGVVSTYRRCIDNNGVTKSDYEDLLDFGNRCGFTDEYYFSHNSKEMVTYVKPNYATNNDKLHESVKDRYVEKQSKIKISGFISLRINEALVFSIFNDKKSVTIYKDPVMEAKNKPVLCDDIISRLKKTGDTPFEFENIEVDMDDNIFVPNGVLNQIRREAIEKLIEEILEDNRRESVDIVSEDVDFEDVDFEKVDNTSVAVSIEQMNQLTPVLECENIDSVYLDWNIFDDTNRIQKIIETVNQIESKNKNAYLILPTIAREKTIAKMNAIVSEIKKSSLTGFVVKNYESLWWAINNFSDRVIVSDHNMYTYNDFSKKAFGEAGVSIDTMPLELNAKEIMARDNFNTEMIVYGHYPVMTTAGCVNKNSIKCDKKSKVLFLKDRYNKEFPVKNNCSECYNTVYNAIPTCLKTSLSSIKKAGVSRIRLAFTIEKKDEVSEVLKAFFDESKTLSGEFTNGHYKRGVE